MRLVDCFVDTFVYLREFARQIETEAPEYDDVRAAVTELFEQSKSVALENGYHDEVYESAKYAVVAYADEVISCSAWTHRSRWQKDSLQRLYFDATNLGASFYDKLNDLHKFGPDREVREVFSLCLGLGFRGKYFSPSDRQKYEEVKAFNLELLLPDEAQRNIDTATLFPSAYGDSANKVKGDYRPRFNVIPYVIAAPVLIVAAAVMYTNRSIVETLNAIVFMVK